MHNVDSWPDDLVAVLVVGVILLRRLWQLLILLTVRRRPAELLGGAPVLLEGQVKHGVVRITGHLLYNIQELGHAVLQGFACER